ncbi:hypothetical protein IIC65_03045, partial [Candidatus Sumerlaeota bacterium]|nr:hypothetical protein [Candidatus Sumerlaeota bacterium]
GSLRPLSSQDLKLTAMLRSRGHVSAPPGLALDVMRRLEEDQEEESDVKKLAALPQVAKPAASTSPRHAPWWSVLFGSPGVRFAFGAAAILIIPSMFAVLFLNKGRESLVPGPGTGRSEIAFDAQSLSSGEDTQDRPSVRRVEAAQAAAEARKELDAPP